MNAKYLSAGVFAALIAATLAGCGGGSKPTGVASLNGSSPGSGTTTTVPHGSPTQLLNEWAQCMRQHGVPNLVDPTIDTNGTIHITMPAQPGSQGALSFGPGGKDSPCQSYLSAASTALRGGQPLQKPDPAKLTAFSRCMRAHGIADFPDPTSGGGLRISAGAGSDLNPNSPAFQSAQKACSKSVGLPGLGGGPQRGGIMVQSGTAGTGGPGAGSAGQVGVG
jgi:hypothetical protein